MRRHGLGRFALSRPHPVVVQEWGEKLVFKVAGRMFLLISLDGDVIETVGFKCR
ncbi:MAG: MmcQ/YjbR family DNA-binding protein [Opitutaceae bacterium]|nr:MmcQ/YjbR family DNA-binding protein [Opitutaceae bacterium]